MSSDVLVIIFSVIALLVAIIGHEIMHGFVAYKYGDNTAKNSGRLSINPIVHIDLLGSIIVPISLFVLNAPFLFGWAKPVPVDSHVVYKNGGHNALIAVSLAGITYNLALAVFCGVFISFTDNLILQIFLYLMVTYNVVLGILNLIPIPPLDGANALNYLAQKLNLKAISKFYESIWNYGMIIFIGFLMFEPINAPIFRFMQDLIILIAR